MKIEAWQCDFCGKVSQEPVGWLSVSVNGVFSVRSELAPAMQKHICTDDCAVGTFKQWLSQRGKAAEGEL